LSGRCDARRAKGMKRNGGPVYRIKATEKH